MRQLEQQQRVVEAVANLREYFHDALQGALVHRNVAVEDQTEHYVVNLLTLYARSENLFEPTHNGIGIRPLVKMLSDAALRRPPRVSASAACSALAMYRCSSPGFLRTASRAS